MQEKHVAQVTGTITLVQISNTDNNSQIITVTVLSDLETKTVSKSLIMTVTELSIELSSPAFQLALQTKLHSRLSKAFALRLYTLARLIYVTWKYLAHSNISCPNGDIEKMIAYSRIFDLRKRPTSSSPGAGVQALPLLIIPCLLL
ncbi:hypothetical protein AVEN_206766-1 [Araneus ventricosus]|uniref:Uncharacterized protein n=1 Tax=Araneus ventricosus TaxID=182803 RepID=A0A4Y2C6G6_ARAVE|nr:hypothetical protein AVEN_206766-1 [Araneus ventricosus]